VIDEMTADLKKADPADAASFDTQHNTVIGTNLKPDAGLIGQIKNEQIKVYVYNSQNATPDVPAQVDAATAAGIPVTTITGTLIPARATFQDWQVAQFTALKRALAQATGR
jgi:zinc/manganese transport system substrate-binding protein